MVGVELRGRLGNQMFQYAFALAASRRLNVDVTLYVPPGVAPEGEQLTRYFVLDQRGLSMSQDLGYPRRWIDNQDYDRPEEVLSALTDLCSYGGYFQSERFFAEVENEVRAAFRIRPELEATFRERYGALLREPYVCCPIRRADYRTFLGGSQLPLRYYHDGLALISPPSGTPIVFIGDELDEVSRVLGCIDGARFEPSEPIVEFQLLLHAHDMVIPNSSFAWWGAWLAERCEVVVAPRYWLGWRHRAGWHRHSFGAVESERVRGSWEYPPAVIPPRWSQVPIRREWRERLAPWSIKSSLALVANNARASR